jgi:hypothetical protein
LREKRWRDERRAAGAEESICFGKARAPLSHKNEKLTRIPGDQGALLFRDRVQCVQEDLWEWGEERRE